MNSSVSFEEIRRLVALRGDLPSSTGTAGEFRYASELIAFIREQEGNDWHIEVAAYPEYHPQERYAKRDLQNFAAKVKAGADSAITQFFFNPDAYFHFVDEVRALGSAPFVNLALEHATRVLVKAPLAPAPAASPGESAADAPAPCAGPNRSWPRPPRS
jgi:hypothetical protein